MKIYILLVLPLLIISPGWTQEHLSAPYRYGIALQPWPEEAGNHRAALQIDQATEAVYLEFEWRRPDDNTKERQFRIVHAQTGKAIANIQRLEVNNEVCKLVFGPVPAAGTYYFYYLPYQVQSGSGWYGKGYYPPENPPAEKWTQQLPAYSSLPRAKISEVQARTKGDSFYPMEITATSKEIDEYQAKYPAVFWLFPEDRQFPIRMKHRLPYKWLSTPPGATFKGTALQNEYYTFQIGVVTGKLPLDYLQVTWSALIQGKDTLPITKITCFNTEGINPLGKYFKKQISVPAKSVQPLWFGIDIPENCPAGLYKGQIHIASGKASQYIPVEIIVKSQVIAERGDSELWRMSRLRWLNSTAGIDDHPIAPYTPLKIKKQKIECLGRSVTLANAGLPKQIHAWTHALLTQPMQFIILTEKNDITLPGQFQFTEKKDGKVCWEAISQNTELKVSCEAIMEADGWLNYTYTLTPFTNIRIKDIRLEISLEKEIAQYIVGIGLPGQNVPAHFDGKWSPTDYKLPEATQISIPISVQEKWVGPFDSFWIGSTKGGLHCELRGSSYTGPLLNLYHPSFPSSWYNEGKGGFIIDKQTEAVKAVVYSGSRNLTANQPIDFEFAFLITPVKTVNTKSQFTDRYYHNGSAPVPTDEDVKAGVKIINIHHANRYNPFINYPFFTVDRLKDFTKVWHEKGCKVKIYYTIRELTSALPEIWALRSLGDEILTGGNGGGYPWLREHLVTGYTPQWYHHFEEPEAGIMADAALLTSTGSSRWYNYYIEGLAWVIKHTNIDGLYLDDVAFGRDMLKRMRKVMEDVKPGCIIDLHSNTGFSKGPANQYAEFFPYIDKLWFGESFQYNRMSPANWLVEVSGIPFGLMSDMLHAGGNKWLGMQYGMTVRHPWRTEGIICDPRPVWQLWDQFDIAESHMYGFWEINPIVTTSDPNVKVTAYLRKDKVLLSVGNYTDQAKEVSLHINWKHMPVKASETRMIIPEIQDFQKAETLKENDLIQIAPRKGKLILIY